jgi:hypothetical protein
MPFCTNCGKPYKEQHKFCQSCGMPLGPAAGVVPPSSPPAPPPAYQPVSQVQPVFQAPQPAVSGEPLRNLISGLSISKGFMRFDNFNLIITDYRSIFAKITQQIMNEAVKAARDNAQAQGKGFWGKWGAQLNMANNYWARYKGMTPDQILLETQGNFAIENQLIQKIKVKDECDNDDDGGSKTQYEIEFETVTGKFKFKTAFDPKKQLIQIFGAGLVK